MATQGCPCGYRGDPAVICRCPPRAVDAYRARISGPLLDRMDLVVEVPRVSADDLKAPPGEPSSAVRARVEAARRRQRARLGPDAPPLANARLSPGQARALCSLDEPARRLLDAASRAGLVSARGYEKLLKVALTIADLEGAPAVRDAHLAEAIAYRGQEPACGAQAA